MKYTREIKWMDLPIVVEGTYHREKNNGYWDPPDAEEYEIEKVMLGEYNVTELVDAAAGLEEIEDLIISQAREEYYGNSN